MFRLIFLVLLISSHAWGQVNPSYRLVEFESAEGIYSPTYSATLNLDSTPTSLGSWTYFRYGNRVHAFGVAVVSYTAASTQTSFAINLPIYSDLLSREDAIGSISLEDAAAPNSESNGYCRGNATNDTLECVWVSLSTNNSRQVYIEYSYKIQ